MPKTKNAFALRNFDAQRIWKQKIFYPRSKSKNSPHLVFDMFPCDSNNMRALSRVCFFASLREDETDTDEKILENYHNQAVYAQEDDNHVEIKIIIELFGIFSKNLTAYMNRIFRHYQRLEKYSRKWNETICENETFSAIEIRTKTQRIQTLLKFYEYVQETIKNLQRSIKRHIAEITDACEKADQNIFAIRLRQARKKIGLTQTQLANAIGMTAGGYTNYENSLREPSLATLKKIVRTLNVSADWLLGLTL